MKRGGWVDGDEERMEMCRRRGGPGLYVKILEEFIWPAAERGLGYGLGEGGRKGARGGGDVSLLKRPERIVFPQLGVVVRGGEEGDERGNDARSVGENGDVLEEREITG